MVQEVQSSGGSVVSVRVQHRSRQWPSWRLAPLFLLLIQSAARSLGRIWASVASYPVDAGIFRDGRATHGGRQRPTSQNGVLRTAQTTSELRVAVLSSVITAAPSPWRGTRERALCRRHVPVSRSVEFVGCKPSSIELNPGIELVAQSAVAQYPNPPVHPLARRNCSPE